MAVLQNIRETPLCKLAFKYGTDKCPRIRHPYTPFYYELFKGRQDSVKKILEIGVGYKARNRGKQYPDYQIGASLMMWRDFFPNAQVHGIDIRPDSMITGERIHTYLCDQSNKEQLEALIKKIGGDIDIVIDDGSHQHQHQVFTTRVLMPLLKEDVTYIIEDVQYPGTVERRLGNFNRVMIYFPYDTYRSKYDHVKNDKLAIILNR